MGCLTKNIALIGEKKTKIFLSACLITFVVAFAFLPSLKNGFTNFDDDAYVTNNPIIRDLSLEGIKRIFTPATYIILHPDPPQLYVPLVTLSCAIEYHFFKLNPFVYHTTNLVLHLLNCLFVFWFVFLLARRISVAFIVSILFGVHPLHVESVAWITERKDVLSAFFFLGTLICYIYYQKYKIKPLIVAQLVFFTSALLSKAVAVTLPFVMLLYDYYISRKIDKDNLFEKAPFFIIVAVFVFFSKVATEYRQIDPAFTIFDHLLIPCYALIFYLGKLIMPIKLSCVYPYPLKNGSFLPFVFLIAPVLLLTLYISILFSLKYTRKLFFGLLFFLFAVFPYLQILPFSGPAIVADRYAYIPSIGIFFIFAEFVIFIMNKKKRYKRILGFILPGVLFVAITLLVVLTWNRCKVWKDSLTLWNDVINKYPDGYIPIAYFNRGAVYMRANENERAVLDFNRSLELCHKKLNVDYVDWGSVNNKSSSKEKHLDVYSLIAMKFARINMPRQAIVILNNIIKISPSYVDAYSNLAAIYGRSGMYKKAVMAAKEAVEIDSHSSLAHYNLCVAYYFDNQCDLALKHLELSRELGFKPNPGFLGELLGKCGYQKTKK